MSLKMFGLIVIFAVCGAAIFNMYNSYEKEVQAKHLWSMTV